MNDIWDGGVAYGQIEKHQLHLIMTMINNLAQSGHGNDINTAVRTAAETPSIPYKYEI